MMNTDAGQNQKLTPVFVRDQLDKILAREITALLDVDSTFAVMSFNLATISCVTLVIEREREIKQHTDFPPERYTKESFVNELVEIGLEKDNSLETAVHSVLSNGYISTDENGLLKAEMPAFIMVGFLDNMFPGMQGMNLVAFVLQMNDEVNSGRKSLELAAHSFQSTLKSRGVSVSKDRAEKKASEIASGVVTTPSRSKEISLNLKKENVNRLSSLIKHRKKRSIESPDQLHIKDVFNKGPSPEALEDQKAEIKAAEEAVKIASELARELAEKDEKIKTAEAAAKEAERQLEELAQREKQLLAAQEKAAKETASQLEAREALMAEKESQLKALEEKLNQDAEHKRQQEEDARQEQIQAEEKEKASQADEDIESQIAAFENDLAMPCPLCKHGEVISKTTEKGKTFFSCAKPDCRFVSWEKPYYFECPLCKNSFLTETTAPTGEKGLKCPRASCSYIQNNLYDPKQNMTQAVSNSTLKKKKRVVRRKRH